jgi:hypothetical protein
MGRGGRPEYRVVALADARTGKIGYIGYDRKTRPARWRAVWPLRDRLSGQLVTFLKSLSEEPRDLAILGGGCGVPMDVARAAADIIAGWYGLRPTKQPAWRGRPVARIVDETVTIWPSQAEAGRALGITRVGVLKLIYRGRLVDLG